MSKLRMTPAAISAAVRGDFENLMVAATPGGIEAQEKAGQKSFAADETLPIEGSQDAVTRSRLESLGFVFDNRPVGNELFIKVKFPAGWKKVPTDHSMWTDLVDDRGRKRGGLFYKAAFYDRHAHLSLTRRFSTGIDYTDKMSNEEKYICCIFDQGVAVHIVGTAGKQDWTAQDKLDKDAKEWLRENYPNWEDPTAYWD